MIKKSFKFFQKHVPYQMEMSFPRERLTRTPTRQIPVRQEYDTPELRGIFLQGWRACERGGQVYNNPYGNVENLIYSQHSAWEMGYLDCHNTRRTNPQVEQTREYITDMFSDAQTHGFCAGVHNTQLILHYEGDMDNQSIRAMLHDLTIRYRTCLYFSDLTLNNMEDFLNEHLNGRSTLRLA